MKSKLGELGSFVAGNSFPQAEQGSVSGDYPFAKVSDLAVAAGRSWGGIQNWVTSEQVDRLRWGLIPPRSTVFAKIGEGLRRERLAFSSQEMAIDNNLMAFIPDLSRASSTWIYYRFRTLGISEHAAGSAMPYLRKSDLEKIELDVPPREVQEAIGEVLGALDDKIAANRDLRATLRLMTTALVQAASGETESHSLASVCSTITRGIAPKYADGGLRVINQKCVRNGAVDLSRARWSSSVPKSDEKLLVDADVLINSTGQGTLGRVGRWVGYGELATVDSHVSIVRVDPNLADPTFVGAVLLELEKQVEDLAEGSTGQTELRRDHLAALQLRLPDLAIQRATGDRIRVMDNRSNLARDENFILARTRDELLPLLMSGRITVKDAERAAEDVL